MAQRQQKLVDVVLQDPAVDNVSSFIGVDGTNTTLNSGRIQINAEAARCAQDLRDAGDPAPAGQGEQR